jgi:hypothetical protein
MIRKTFFYDALPHLITKYQCFDSQLSEDYIVNVLIEIYPAAPEGARRTCVSFER